MAGRESAQAWPLLPRLNAASLQLLIRAGVVSVSCDIKINELIPPNDWTSAKFDGTSVLNTAIA